MEYTIGSRVLDGWEIVRPIGAGSYGKVFEVRKTSYGVETVSALKVIRIPESPAEIRSALNDGMDEQSVTGYFKGFVDEILHEIAMMSAVKSHPNVVSYEDHHLEEYPGEIRWDILIRMELLMPLEHYLREQAGISGGMAGTLPVPEVARLGREIASALAFCQRKNIIHRDIKPENIFISETGQFKLGDFGVAKTAASRSTGGSHKGTERYMAPEVFLNQPYGPTVDIYSLGLVLYRLLNGGRLPFLPPAPKPLSFGDYENAQIKRMKGEPIPPPAKADAALAAIVLKACAFHSAERFRSAAELQEALDSYVRSHADEGTNVLDEDPSASSQEQGQAMGEKNREKGQEQIISPENSERPEGTVGSWGSEEKPEATEKPPERTVGSWGGVKSEGTVGSWDSEKPEGTVGNWNSSKAAERPQNGTVGSRGTDGGRAQVSPSNTLERTPASSGGPQIDSGKQKKRLAVAGAVSALFLIFLLAIVVIPKLRKGPGDTNAAASQVLGLGSGGQTSGMTDQLQEGQEEEQMAAFENKLAEANLLSPGELIVGIDQGKDDSSLFISGEKVCGVDGEVIKALGELSGLNILTYHATSQIEGTFGRNFDMLVSAVSKDEPPEMLQEYAALSEPYYTESYALLECRGAKTGFTSLEEAAIEIIERTDGVHANVILPRDMIPEGIRQTVKEMEDIYIYSAAHDIYDCLILLKKGDVDAILLPFSEAAGLETAFPEQFCVSCVDESCRTDYCIAVGKENPALLEAVNEAIPLLQEQELLDLEAYAAHLQTDELLVMAATEQLASVESDENVRAQWESAIEAVSAKADFGAWPSGFSYGGSLEQLEEDFHSGGFMTSLSDGILRVELENGSIQIEDEKEGKRRILFSFDYNETVTGEEDVKALIPVDGEYFGGSLSDILTAWGISPELFYTVSPALSISWHGDDGEWPCWSLDRAHVRGSSFYLQFEEDASNLNGVGVRADKDRYGEERICEIWFRYKRVME